MKVRLAKPVRHDGATYRRVSVRIPADPSVFELSCPPDRDEPSHNLSVLLGMPVEAIPILADVDVHAIGLEFERQLQARKASLIEVNCK